MSENDHNQKFGTLLKEVAANSSLHGIPKIVTSKYKYQKMLWIILVIGTSCYLCYQTSQLFKAFYSRPIKTSVSLEFNRLRFPAISICNMNPIKKGQLGMANMDILKVLHLEGDTKKRKKRFAGTTDNQNQGTDDTSSSASLSPSSVCTQNCDIMNTGTANPITSLDASPTAQDTASSIMPSYSLSTGTETTKPLEWNWMDSSSDSSSSSDTGTTDYYDSDTDYGSYSQYYSQYDYYFDEWDAPKDQWHDRIEKFKEVYQNETNNFTSFQSPDYGNCYTLSQEKFMTTRTGPLYGLWLTLNLETREYLTSYASAFGIRLVIHEQGTYPFPAEEGLTLSPGHEATIGIKMINVSRLGQPYGDCNDGIEFEKTFGIRYTIPACVQLCKQRWIIDGCGCVSANIDVEISEKNTVSPSNKNQGAMRVCDLSDTKDYICTRVIDAKYNRGELDCFCESPCKEIAYTKTISGRNWPNDDYLRYKLMTELCAKTSSIGLTDCENFKMDMARYPLDSFKTNFLQVILYYEDLNYEFIKEDPLYDNFQFVSDIGGTLGLFMGASILSAFEVIHFLLELANFVRKKASAVGASRSDIFKDKEFKKKIDDVKTRSNSVVYGDA